MKEKNKIAVTIMIPVQVGENDWKYILKTKVFVGWNTIDQIVEWAVTLNQNTTFAQLQFSDIVE